MCLNFLWSLCAKAEEGREKKKKSKTVSRPTTGSRHRVYENQLSFFHKIALFQLHGALKKKQKQKKDPPAPLLFSVQVNDVKSLKRDFWIMHMKSFIFPLLVDCSFDKRRG